MKIIIAGASGLVGTPLVASLRQLGHQVVQLVRSGPTDEQRVLWSPSRGAIDPDTLEGADAIINLAGENIASGRWTKSRKDRIRQSRLDTTELLAATLAGLKHRPRHWVNASAIGFYGDRGDELLTECSPPGAGFLAETCIDWEHAAARAESYGVRVVRARIGVVLTPEGGALARMLPPFRMGVGGPVASGDQYMSWITLDDVVRAIIHCVEERSVEGAVNLVSPDPVTNAEFSRELGRTLHRPAVFPLPALAARLAFGEMADELLLASMRVSSSKLEETGFRFVHPTLSEALSALLHRREAA